MKKKRVVEGKECSKWSKKHGQDTYFGGCSDSGNSAVEEGVCDIGDGVNQNTGKGKGSDRGKGKTGRCAACGSNTHQPSNHKDCPFHISRSNKEAHSDGTLMLDSESGEYISDGGSSDSEKIPVHVELKGELTKEVVP